MPTPKKPATPSIELLTHGACHRDTPPIRPKGCDWEMWGGAVGIDHGLVVWDVNTQDASAAPVGFASELSPSSRRALAAYMIELWRAFAAEIK
jgi:hypothetical protein